MSLNINAGLFLRPYQNVETRLVTARHKVDWRNPQHILVDEDTKPSTAYTPYAGIRLPPRLDVVKIAQ
jgi:hypothetical protein